MNLFRLNRFTLILALFSWAFVAVLGISALFLWHSSDVEQLVKQYPYFNKAKQEYDFSIHRPKNWVGLGGISRHAQWAIIVSEDWAFYTHNGLDLNQLQIVLEESYKEHKLGRGASTITQQVIKNTILSNERSVWRKLREMVLALKVERHLSKAKILEIYLNIVELGDNIYGIKEASKYYFNKDPKSLTAREGAFLAMLLPSPVKYSTSFRKKELTPFAQEVIDSILLKMRQARIIEEEERQVEAKRLFYWEKQMTLEQPFEFKIYE